MKTRKLVMFATVLGMGLALGACSDYKDAEGDPQKVIDKKMTLERDAQAAIANIKAKDPSLSKFFESAAGYAVFPKVGKGGFLVGGAGGDGVVYEAGRIVGYAGLAQATIGAQVGGQAYTQIIFFKTQERLNEFKSGGWVPTAQASAVAIKSGAGANSDYEGGVAIFTLGEAGAMLEAAVGGQRYKYEAK